MAKAQFLKTSSLAYLIFAGGLVLAWFSPAVLLEPIRISGWIFCGLGILCCIGSVRLDPKASGVLGHSEISPAPGQVQSLALLFLAQIAFLGISFLFFHFLERQTQVNARLHFVETGYILGVLQEQPLSLGLMPWATYSILGLGLAYLSLVKGKAAIFSCMLRLAGADHASQKTLRFFLDNLLRMVTEVVSLGPFLFILSFALLWLCEMVHLYFGWTAIFANPIRAVFICALLILTFQKSNKRLIKWMDQYQVSLGKTLMVYIMAFSVFLCWLSFGCEWLLADIGIGPIEQTKSYFAGFFTEQSLHTRIHFLIWGWWSIWIPWMASVVARASVGSSILSTLCFASLLPVIVFAWGIQQITPADWIGIYQWIDLPQIQILCVLGLLLFIWKAWGGIYTMGDVARGAMYPIGRLSKRSLKRWMTMLTLWLAFYIPGCLMLGWLLAQFMLSLGGIFMLLVLALFVSAWCLAIFRERGVKRQKLLELP